MTPRQALNVVYAMAVEGRDQEEKEEFDSELLASPYDKQINDQLRSA